MSDIDKEVEGMDLNFDLSFDFDGLEGEDLGSGFGFGDSTAISFGADANETVDITYGVITIPIQLKKKLFNLYITNDKDLVYEITQKDPDESHSYWVLPTGEPINNIGVFNKITEGNSIQEQEKSFKDIEKEILEIFENNKVEYCILLKHLTLTV